MLPVGWKINGMRSMIILLPGNTYPCERAGDPLLSCTNNPWQANAGVWKVAFGFVLFAIR